MEVSAIVFPRPGEVEFGRFELPPMRPHHLLIQTLWSFVSSGTETRVWQGHYGAEKNFPFIPGYACVGRVLEVGAEATGYRVGDLVSYNAASDEDSRPRGVNLQWGGQASTHLVPHWWGPVVLPPDAAAHPQRYVMAQVAAISLRGVELAQPQRGETAVVIGQGVIGAFSAALLAAAGCRVLVSDVEPARLERAARYGVAGGVNAKDPDAAARLLALARGGADVVVESSGVPAGLKLAHRLIRKSPAGHGAPVSWSVGRWPRLVYQASYLEDVPLHPTQFFEGEGVLLLTPVDRGAEDRQRAVEAIRTGRLDADAFLDRTVSWRDAAAQYHDLAHRRGDVFSVAFDWTAG